MVGALIYAEVYTLVFEPLLVGGGSKLTLSDLFSVPPGIIALVVVIIAFATFIFLGKIEGSLYKKK